MLLIQNLILELLMYYLVLEGPIAHPVLFFLCCEKEPRWLLHLRRILVHLKAFSCLETNSETPVDEICSFKMLYPKNGYCL